MSTEEMNREQVDRVRLGTKLCSLVSEIERVYEAEQADNIVRNLAYYRGRFWRSDGHGLNANKHADYASQQNEVFPILDSITSALAMDLPQVEALKQTISSQQTFTRQEDPTIRGRRVAAVLNHFAEDDDLDETVHEWVLQACIFPRSVVKVSWSVAKGAPVWRNKMPWEVHFDPTARHPRDAAWVFERFVLHESVFKERVKSGVYELGEREIKPDTYPRSLLDRHAEGAQETERRLQDAGLREYIGLVEWWDFRKGKVYHLHPESKTLLMETDIPYERPYEVLVFHPGVGRIDGIPDVDLIAETQRDINELVSARREIVARLVRRMLVDSSFFQSEEEWERFKNAKAWEPARVKVPANKRIEDAWAMTPEMGTTFDFNRHLEEDKESVRRVVGESDYQRGQAQNIRTAAEMHAIRSSIEGRMNTRVKRLVKGVSRLFRKAHHVLRWAIQNPEESQIDLAAITFATQDDVTPEVLAEDVLQQMPRFRLLPFSPLMEDKIARRENLVQLLASLLGPAFEGVLNTRELLREIVDEFGWRPSLLTPEAPPAPEPAPPGAPGPLPGLPPMPGGEPTGFPEIPPDQVVPAPPMPLG